jgi:hypothetical protein
MAAAGRAQIEDSVTKPSGGRRRAHGPAMCDPSTKRPENIEHPPTSTMIDGTRLSHPDFLIEIDLVAITEA